jgi:hypothetical protein
MAGLRHVCADNDAASHQASLIRNGAVSPSVISPKGAGPGGEPMVLTKEQRDLLLHTIREKLSGDSKGDPAVFNVAVEVAKMGLSPDELVLDEVHNLAEERLCALMGIPPVVLALGTGLQNNSQKATLADAVSQAYDNAVKPTWRLIADALTSSPVGRELLDNGQRFGFETTHIAALAEDQAESAARDDLACGGPWETVDEVRARRGLAKIAGGDKLREKQAPKPAVNPNAPKLAGDPAAA